MTSEDIVTPPLPSFIQVEVIEPVSPFGGVQIFNAADNVPVQIQIPAAVGPPGPEGPPGPSGPEGPSGETGAVVDSVFTRIGDVVALPGDYAAFYADINHVHSFASITGKPTTLAGYGITDAYTKTQSDALYAPVAHTHTFASLTGKPTTLAGYGITDAQPLDTDLTAIAALTTTSFGRGFLTLADAAASRTYINAQIAGSYEPALGNPSTNGYILSSTTGGVRSWIAPPTGGGGGTPGGSTTQVQFNDAGAFGGDADLTWDKTNNILTLVGVTGATPRLGFSCAGGTLNLGVAGTWGELSAMSNPGDSVLYANSNLILWSQNGGILFDTKWAGLGGEMQSAYLSQAGKFSLTSTGMFGFTSSTQYANSAIDTALARNAAGVFEINNGTAGTYRDLYARNITLQSSGIITGKGTVPPGGATNQVLSKVSGTDYDLAWVAPTSGGSGSPGGSTTQVQFNDAGAFGGDADLTWDKTSNVLTNAGQYRASDSGGFMCSSGGSFNSGLNAGAGSSPNILHGGSSLMQFNQSLGIQIPSTQILGWTTSFGGTPNDTALARNAAGVLEINNGTAGSYRDLKLRSLILSGGTTITISAPGSAVGNFLKDDGTWAAAAGGGGGNVSNSGTPANLQYARWTDATHISGVPASTMKTDLGLTATDVGLGSVTNDAQTKAAIVPNSPTPTDGQLLVGVSVGAKYNPRTISGSGATISLNTSGVLAISAIALASLVSSAITIGNAGSISLGGSATLDAITGFSSVGIIKRTGANAYAAAVAGTDYQAPITLPIGAIVGTTDTQTLTAKRINPRVSTSATSNTTPTPNGDTDDLYIATSMSVNMVFGAPTGTPVDGQRLLIRIKDNGTARTLGWNAAYVSSQSILPTATIAGKTITVGLIRNAQTSTWDCIAVDIEDAVFANFTSASPQTPTAITSTTGLMAGLGTTSWGSNGITPNVSGKIVIMLTGALSNALINSGALVKIRYGAGAPAAAPANGASPTGTATQSNPSLQILPAAALVPFTCVAIITGLTVGTAYWLDAVVSNAGSTGAVTVFNAVFTAWEIP